MLDLIIQGWPSVGGAILGLYGLWQARADVGAALVGCKREWPAFCRFVAAAYRARQSGQPLSAELRELARTTNTAPPTLALVYLSLGPLILGAMYWAVAKYLLGGFVASPGFGLLLVVSLWVWYVYQAHRRIDTVSRLMEPIRREQARAMIRK